MDRVVYVTINNIDFTVEDIRTCLKYGILCINEVRTALGLEPIEGGEYYHLLTPTGWERIA